MVQTGCPSPADVSFQMSWVQEPFQPQISIDQLKPSSRSGCTPGECQTEKMILGSFVPNCNPDVELAEDPMPEFDETTVEWTMSNALSQKSKKPPRSSFFTFEFPPGLPEHESAAPNRWSHEIHQDMVLEFMQQVEAMPSGLQKKVKEKRKQSFGSATRRERKKVDLKPDLTERSKCPPFLEKLLRVLEC